MEKRKRRRGWRSIASLLRGNEGFLIAAAAGKMRIENVEAVDGFYPTDEKWRREAVHVEQSHD